MKKSPQLVKRNATMMKNPDAGFVAVVDRGANKTPFKVLKKDETAEPTTDVLKVEKVQVVKIEEKVGKADNLDVVKMEFKKDIYDTVEKVESYLSSYGYSDFEILETDSEYLVESIEKKKVDNSNLISLNIDNGIIFFISNSNDMSDVAKKEGTAKAEVTPIMVIKNEKALECVKKFSIWKATSNDSDGETSMLEILKEGADGLPPFMWELNEAFSFALRNAIIFKQEEQIPAIFEEYKNYVLNLLAFFKEIVIPEGIALKRDEFITKLFTMSTPENKDIVSKNDGQQQAAPQAPTEPVPAVVVENQVPASEGAKPEEGQPQQSNSSPDIAAVVAEAVQKAMDKFSTEVIAPLTKDLTSAKDSAKKMEEEITNLKNTKFVPSRKSADGDATNNIDESDKVAAAKSAADAEALKKYEERKKRDSGNY